MYVKRQDFGWGLDLDKKEGSDAVKGESEKEGKKARTKMRKKNRGKAGRGKRGGDRCNGTDAVAHSVVILP